MNNYGTETWTLRFRSEGRESVSRLFVLFPVCVGFISSVLLPTINEVNILWVSGLHVEVEAARQPLDSFCDICFLHLLQCHSDIKWQRCYESAPKTFNLTQGIQVKTMKLICHLCFSLPISLWSSHFTLFYSLCHHPSSKLLSPKWNPQIVSKMTRYSRKWKGWKGRNTKKMEKIKGKQVEIGLLLQRRQFGQYM